MFGLDRLATSCEELTVKKKTKGGAASSLSSEKFAHFSS